jgi:hypothetical protein
MKKPLWELKLEKEVNLVTSLIPTFFEIGFTKENLE